MFRSSKPTWRRTWARSLLLLFIVVPIAGIAWWGLRQIRSQQLRDVGNTLRTVLQTTQEGLHIWASDTRNEVAFWGQSPALRSLVERQIAAPRSAAALRASPALAQLRDLLEPVLVWHHYLGFSIVTPDGVQIADSVDGELGRDDLKQLDPGTLATALTGSPVLGHPFRTARNRFVGGEEAPGAGSPEMVVAAPVWDNGGYPAAVLAFYLDPSRDFTRVTQLGRTGETGETYAFDRTGRLVTESRFDDQLRSIGLIPPGGHAILSIEIRDPGGNMLQGYRPARPRSAQPLNRMAESAISGRSDIDLDGYRDYRGVPVVGAWTWDPELELGLATEIDTSEAYRSLVASSTLTMFMLGVTLLSTFAGMGFLWQRARHEESARTEAQAHVVKLKEIEAALQEAVRSRDEFLSIASHELKTPLTTLKLDMQYLLRNQMRPDGGISPLKLRRLAETSDRQVDRLSRVIDDLLDTVRISAGQLSLKMEEVDLSALVAELLDRFHDQMEAAGCAVDLQSPGPIFGQWDRFRIEQVIANLLTNAMKYGQGKPICLRLRGEAERASVEVEDHGIGIAREHQAKIFERFGRAVSARQFGGLGLGLYIVRQIVEQHGGTVRVHSTIGVGSTFVIELPRAPGPAHAPSA